MDEPYPSIAVLVERIDGLKDLISEKFVTNEVSHNAILQQTIKTNGRVTGLENNNVDLSSWRNRITGGLIVSNAVIIPILIWLVIDHFKK